MNIEPGHVIDAKYRIVRLLGTGGMGAVYEGENARIRRKVAIKLLHGNVSSQAEAVQRFEREAQAAGRIGSEHICEVLDLGVLGDGTRYMVMEYLEGENMSARIQRAGRLSPAMSTPLMVQVLDALSAAHAAGIIHRDLKPDNVWIIPLKSGIKDFIKILDFGVSKFSQLGGEESMSVTRAGAVVGTPYYMSPEQARGMSQVDQRTDIYAIGVLLYQATTGQVPYQAETFNELLFKIVLEPAPPPQTYVPDLDPEFAAIISRAMAREPTQRYQTCAEFREALVAYQARGERRPVVTAHSNGGVGGTMLLDTSQIPAVQAAQAQAQGAPQPWAGSSQARAPSGANWGSSSSPNAAIAPAIDPGFPAPPTQTTANSWGNASGADPISVSKPPKNNTGLWVAVIGAAVILGGGGVAGVMLLGGKATASGNTPETKPSTSAVAAPAPPPPAPEPSVVESAVPTVASVTPPPTASATPTAEPATTKASQTTRPNTNTPRPKTTASATPKTPKNTTGSGDLGY